MSSDIALKLNNLSHGFRLPDGEHIQLFKNLNVQLLSGSSYSIVGQSGCGKTTLLSLMAGLELPESGEVKYFDKQAAVAVAESNQYIRQNSGFVFQQFHLLHDFNVLNNVALPLKLRSLPDAENIAKEWLAKVGLEKRVHQPIKQLSGGEQQRVAIARACVTQPKILFADEPTGNLDPSMSEHVFELLLESAKLANSTLIMVTHDRSLAEKTDYRLSLENQSLHLSANQLLAEPLRVVGEE